MGRVDGHCGARDLGRGLGLDLLILSVYWGSIKEVVTQSTRFGVLEMASGRALRGRGAARGHYRTLGARKG